MFKKLSMLLGLAGFLLLLPLALFAGSTSQTNRPGFGAAHPDWTGAAIEQGNPFPAIVQRAQNGRVQVIVELKDDPLAVVFARENDRGPGRAVSATRAQMAVLKAAQAEVAAEILAIDKTARELFRVQRAYNAGNRSMGLNGDNDQDQCYGTKDSRP